MKLIYRTLLLTIVVMGPVAAPALGEFYQYTDADGVQRFTDDIANVPPAQRPNIKTHQSVKSDPVQLANLDQETGTGALDSKPSSEDASLQNGTWGEKIERQAETLDRMQVELETNYRSLQAERDVLAKKKPVNGASAETRAAYRRQVQALNDKIEAYETRYAEFRKKEKAFNDQYRK